MLTRMHLMSSHIDVFFVYISSHAKVSDLAHFIITHQYVPSSQITMDDLNSKQKRLDISSVSINLLAFYHECCPLIGYATHVLFCDR